MATNTRKLSDFLAEGEGDTFGDLPVENPHIKPGTLYPAWSGLLETNTGFTFTDSGNTGHTITSTEAVQTPNKSKFGNSSAYFDKNLSSNLLVADHADWDMGSGTFTYDFWFNATSLYDYSRVFSTSTTDTRGSMVYLQANGLIGWLIGGGGSWISMTSSAGAVSANTWYHVACVRNGTTATLYLNGTSISTGTYSGAGMDTNVDRLQIGAWKYSGATAYFDGYIDEFRVSKGIARWTSNFTPPTAAYTSDSYTKFLYHADATGVHSGAYGTTQSDGRKYYYTDIKGSKPIKDPRIGTHFGIQRYRLSSAQVQPDMSAAHGKHVFRFEGREWVRGSGNTTTPLYGFGLQHDGNGTQYEMSDGSYIEITGYFSDANIQAFQYTTNRHFTWSVDGGSTTTDTTFRTSINGSPAGGRFNNAGGWHKIGLGTTLGIHTLKIATVDQDFRPYAFELVAQDTTSTATKSKVQIPAQNVVSYGKKFATTAAAHHYDPFNGFTNGTSLHSAFVDTATSLGLDTAPGNSAKWAISNSNNIRPYNGGRVVKWIASDGTIKTSVTMMPPNAQNLNRTASNEITTPSATNTTATPNMSDDAVDFSLAEIAREVWIREFGNGACNGGTGASGNKADFSMLNGADDVGYVMEDGLTGAKGNVIGATLDAYVNTNDEALEVTWIGTGITGDGDNMATLDQWAQNLPYGTHIMRYQRNSTLANSTIKIDGVQVHTSWLNFRKFGFYQPKMPPIPEDACIIADYMLMADHVPQTDGAGNTGKIGKGVRRLSCDRDHFYNGWNGSLEIDQGNAPYGLKCTSASGSAVLIRNVGFATNFVRQTYGQTARTQNWYVNDTGHSSADAKTGVGGAWGSICDLDANITLGNNVLDTYGVTADGNSVIHGSTDFVSPTHTSSHYQTFETPFTKELLGGDRNMEQTNLVVSSDGKTWDEVTRDTSYLGSLCVRASHNNHYTSESSVHINDEWRGYTDGPYVCLNKDFAICYDRVICLVDGEYQIYSHNVANNTGNRMSIIRVNSTSTALLENHVSATGLGNTGMNTTVTIPLRRGDYVQIAGASGDYNEWTSFEIRRV